MAYCASKDKMLITFVDAIDAKTRLLCAAREPSGSCPAALSDAKALIDAIKSSKPGQLDETQAWAEAYRLEGLMVLVEPLENLLPEARLRLDELDAERSSAAPRLKAALTLAEARAIDQKEVPPIVRPSEEGNLRSLLLAIVNEIHWTKQRKFFARPIQKSATRRIVWAGVLSFLLFLLPYIIMYTRPYLNISSDPKDMSIYTCLPLYTALTSGLFGAYFSRLMFIQARGGELSIGELKAAREWTSIFLRGSVGMCGAMVVFFFLRSGIVEGNVFPKFEQFGFRNGSYPLDDVAAGADSISVTYILPSTQLSLLALWCFLAGFSERLVPSILSSTEGQLNTAATRASS